jgi:hypothetical protein
MIVGFTGHQTLSPSTRVAVRAQISQILLTLPGDSVGVCSLAAGADHIFAEEVLARGLQLRAVIPSLDYENSFDDSDARRHFGDLLQHVSSIATLPYDTSSDEAFWQAGQRVVDESDLMIAVWDGELAGGLGGTADVVAYARAKAVPVTIVWPEGSNR